jgi:hypothetical protein
MIYVEIELRETSQPITREAINTYQKGDLFCIYLENGMVEKYPVNHIWRITETYTIKASSKNDQDCI